MSVDEAGQPGWPTDWPSEKGLYEMALGIARRRDPAMELFGDAKLRGLQAAAKGRVLSKGWFRRVMQNAWTDTLRGKAPFTQLQVASEQAYEVHIDPAGTPEEVAMRVEAAQRLLLSMQAMAPRQREVLTLRYFQSRTTEAIAKELGISKATVERDHRQALLRLGSLMEDQRGVFGAGAGVLASATKLRLPTASKAAGAAFVSNAGVLAVVAICLVVIVGLLAAWMPRAGAPSADLESASLRAPSESPDSSELAVVSSSLATIPAEETRSEAILAGDGSLEPRAAAAGPAASPLSKVEVTPAQEIPGRTFSVRVRADGRGVEGWTTREPLLEPDSRDLSSVASTRCLEFSKAPEAGLFTFELPEAAGSWVFTFEDPATWTTVWLVDPATGEASRGLDFDTGSVLMNSPEVTAAGLTTANAVLVGNPEPGVWVVSPCKGADSTTGSWLFEGVLAGSVCLMAINGLRHPDDWAEKSGPWVVPVGDILRLP